MTVPVNETSVASALKLQYHAGLAMLRQGIERCPPEAWDSDAHTNSVWQIAYHTLFFTHLYLQPNEAAFRPWQHHQTGSQYPDGIAGPPDPNSDLPLLPDPYSREQVLEYWDFCDSMVDSAVDALDLSSEDCGFYWYSVNKLEHQFINIRHLQHGAAQIGDRVREAADVGVDWVASGRRRTGADGEK